MQGHRDKVRSRTLLHVLSGEAVGSGEESVTPSSCSRTTLRLYGGCGKGASVDLDPRKPVALSRWEVMGDRGVWEQRATP